jgi:L-lysine 2,3-aminomutase
MYNSKCAKPASSPTETTIYKAYTLRNFRDIPQLEALSEEQIFAVEVVGSVLPFRTNNYVVNQLIDWDNIPDDPIYLLNFPQRGMLMPHHFNEVAALLKGGASNEAIEECANRIRFELNPNPAGQMDLNRPYLGQMKIAGMQHKYKETVLFFPSQGQVCHAYCTFCFRWPQFVGLEELKFAIKEISILTLYLREHPEVSDVLFTGGDPLVMRTRTLASYLEPLLEEGLPNLISIRIGTKALSYWPYRFLTDPDAGDLLALFRRVKQSGKHLAIMAHFNHPNELKTRVVKDAIRLIHDTGAQIRTQAPLLRHINDDPLVWNGMWKEQVRLGCIPYYMFIVRDTGAQHYFSVPLVRAWHIFTEAYKTVSGLARTVQGPIMSTDAGKIQILGVSQINEKRIIVMRLLQGRNPDWVGRPFFAKYDEDVIWLNGLKPAFGEANFFFETDGAKFYACSESPSALDCP